MALDDQARGDHLKENHGYDNYFGPFPGGNGATMPHSPNPPASRPRPRHAPGSAVTQAPRVQFQQGTSRTTGATRTSHTLRQTTTGTCADPSTPNHLNADHGDSALVDNPTRSYRKNPGPPVFDHSLPSQLDAAGLAGETTRLRVRAHQVHRRQTKKVAAVRRRCGGREAPDSVMALLGRHPE